MWYNATKATRAAAGPTNTTTFARNSGRYGIKSKAPCRNTAADIHAKLASKNGTASLLDMFNTPTIRPTNANSPYAHVSPGHRTSTMDRINPI